jgi:ABC-type amino acid transport substrate-binding protein
MQGRVVTVFSLGLICINFLFIHDARAETELIAVAAEHKMLQYMENDEVKGPSGEIFKLLLQTSQLPAPLTFFPWSRAYQTALNRENTLILSMVRTKEREQKFHWLIKVSELVRGFMSLKKLPKNHIRYIKDAKKKVIAVLRDSYSYHSLVNLGFSKEVNIFEVASLEQGIALFLSGKVDLIYTDPNVLVNHFAQQNQNADELVSIHILPQTRRESYIAANINTDNRMLEKLKLAAYKLQADADYQYYLAYKPLIKE